MYYIFLLFIVVANALTFDYNMQNITLWHAENAYCNTDTYLSRNVTNVLADFIPTYHIYDDKHDTQGYIGYTVSQKAIFVVYRGSSSIKNWITNLDDIMTDYHLCDECQVHKGFYLAEQGVINDVINEVIYLQEFYPSYTVIITGHSLGASIATLTAIDLNLAGIYPIRLFNYGSPRIGNYNFAEYASTILADHNRITHNQDIVVHLPTSVRYTHINNEWFEATDDIVVQECIGYEDPNCSYQYGKIHTSIDDHLWYMGVTMGGDGCDDIL